MLADLPIDKSKKGATYKRNTKLKSAGFPVPMTREHVEELKKIAASPEYFAHNYMKIITLDTGLQYFKMHEYQKEWIEYCNKHRFLMAKWSRQSGKCVAPGTLITLRNKTTGEVVTMTIEEFFTLIANEHQTEL